MALKHTVVVSLCLLCSALSIVAGKSDADLPLFPGHEFPVPLDAIAADTPFGPEPFPPMFGPPKHWGPPFGGRPDGPPPRGPPPPHPPGPHPHPPPPPGAMELAVKLLAAVGSGIQAYFAPPAAAAGDEATFAACGNCVGNETMKLLGSVGEAVSGICSNVSTDADDVAWDASAVQEEPDRSLPLRHFCQLYPKLQAITVLALMSRMELNPLSLTISRCASLGPCSFTPPAAPKQPLDLSVEGSMLQLPVGAAVNALLEKLGMQAVESVGEEDRREMLGAVRQEREAAGDARPVRRPCMGMMMQKWIFGGGETGPEEQQAAVAGVVESAEEESMLDFMQAMGIALETKTPCQECIVSGFKLGHAVVSKKVKWVCKNAQCPRIKAMCKFTAEYPYLAMVATVLKLKPWERVVPGCFMIGACQAPPPPGPPPPGPPPGIEGTVPLPIFPNLDLDIFAPPPPPPPPLGSVIFGVLSRAVAWIMG